jgi:hypothetical protein
VKRKGPIEPAKNYNVGYKMKGIDGYIWIVKNITKKDGNKYKRWFRDVKSPIKCAVKSPVTKQVKQNTLTNNDYIIISFEPKIKYNGNIYDFYELPDKLSTAITNYFTSNTFIKKFYKELSYIEDEDYLKSTIIKVSYLIDEILIIYVSCKLTGESTINLKEYTNDLQGLLYKASCTGEPFATGKYLGKNYTIYVNNNVKVNITNQLNAENL